MVPVGLHQHHSIPGKQLDFGKFALQCSRVGEWGGLLLGVRADLWVKTGEADWVELEGKSGRISFRGVGENCAAVFCAIS